MFFTLFLQILNFLRVHNGILIRRFGLLSCICSKCAKFLILQLQKPVLFYSEIFDIFITQRHHFFKVSFLDLNFRQTTKRFCITTAIVVQFENRNIFECCTFQKCLTFSVTLELKF